MKKMKCCEYDPRLLLKLWISQKVIEAKVWKTKWTNFIPNFVRKKYLSHIKQPGATLFPKDGGGNMSKNTLGFPSFIVSFKMNEIRWLKSQWVSNILYCSVNYCCKMGAIALWRVCFVLSVANKPFIMRVNISVS